MRLDEFGLFVEDMATLCQIKKKGLKSERTFKYIF